MSAGRGGRTGMGRRQRGQVGGGEVETGFEAGVAEDVVAGEGDGLFVGGLDSMLGRLDGLLGGLGGLLGRLGGLLGRLDSFLGRLGALLAAGGVAWWSVGFAADGAVGADGLVDSFLAGQRDQTWEFGVGHVSSVWGSSCVVCCAGVCVVWKDCARSWWRPL